MVGFLRACAGAFRQLLTRRGTVKWGDVLDIATEAGANAVPIVLLTGFLIPAIIAFEIGVVALELSGAATSLSMAWGSPCCASSAR